MLSEADILTRRVLELEAQVAERDATIRVLEDRLAGVHNTAQLRAQHVADLQARVAVEAAKAREDYRVQVGELKAQLADVRGLHAAAMDHILDADRQADEARAQVAALTKRAEEAEREHALLREAAAGHREDADRWRRELEEMKAGGYRLPSPFKGEWQEPGERIAGLEATNAALTKRCEARGYAIERARALIDIHAPESDRPQWLVAVAADLARAALESNDGGGNG